MIEENSEHNTESQKKRRPLWLRLIAWTVLIFLCLFAMLVIAFQFTSVQNFAAQKTTQFLSDKLGTPVRVGNVDIDWDSSVNFSDFFIGGVNQDTLISIGSVETDLRKSLWSLLKSEIDLETIEIQNVNLKLKRDAGASEYSLPFSSGSDTGKTESSGKWKVNLSKIFIRNFNALIEDENKASKISVALPEGIVVIEKFDLESQVHLSRLDLNNPKVVWEYGDQNPIDTETLENINPEVHIDSVQSVDVVSIPEILIGQVELHRGSFTRTHTESPDRTVVGKPGVIDYRHLKILDINGSIDLLSYSEEGIELRRPNINAKTGSGFNLRNLAADQIHISEKGTDIKDIELLTGGSRLLNDINLKYRSYDDFNDFANKVYLNVNLDDSKIYLEDIKHWVPSFMKSEFYKRNKGSHFFLDGEIQGRLNNINLKNVDVALDRDVSLKGNLRMKNITDPDNAVINLDLSNLNTSISVLRKRIPGFKLPENFDRLGGLNFSGRFDGFLSDFVAEGLLVSDIGQVDLDMRLDIKNGRSSAKYSGNINLEKFDLGVFTNSSDLGIISGAAEIRNGQGLEPTTAQADVNAVINQFTFKGYSYDELIFDGDIRSGKIDGYMNMADPNMKFDFRGKVDLNQEQPEFDFIANIDTLDLKALNLSNRNIRLSSGADIDATNLALNKFTGDVYLTDLVFTVDDTLQFKYDSLSVHSVVNSSTDKLLQLNSDVVDLEVDGAFLLDELPASFNNILVQSYPEWSERIGLKYMNRDSARAPMAYTLKLDLHNSGQLTELLPIDLDTLSDLIVDLEVKEKDRYVVFELSTPYIGIQDADIEGLNISLDKRGRTSNISVSTDSLIYQNKFQGQQISLIQNMTQDTIYSYLSLGKISDDVRDINMGLKTFRIDDNRYGFTFNQSELNVLGDSWAVSANNSLILGDKYIKADNLFFSNGDQYISLNTIDDKGVELAARNFDLAVVNSLIKEDKIYLEGPLQIFARADNIYHLENFEAELRMDTLLVNGDDFGPLSLVSSMVGIKNSIGTRLKIGNNAKYIHINGTVLPKGFNGNRSGKTELDLYVDIYKLPVKVAEYFIGDGIENTKGNAYIQGRVKGPVNSLDTRGSLRFAGVQTRVLYLGNTLDIVDHTIPITNAQIDLTGARLRDKYGNEATATGAIYHDRLSNFRLGVDLYSPKFLGLNTTREDSDVYYGTAIGELGVKFAGNFEAPNIKIDAHPTTGTLLNIPLDTESRIVENDFIRFYHDTIAVEEKRSDRFKIKGVNVEMDIQVDQESEAQIIFNEAAGDIMRGRGEGDFKVILNRNGDFNIYGVYELTEGDYLYTMKEFYVNKKFEVEPGSKVTWTGDPFNALLDLRAYYNTTTALKSFIQDQLTDFNSSDLNRSQRVKVIMMLDGPLLKPNITFDLEFINLPASLLNPVTTRMSTLQQDPNEMNTQVMGLIVTGGFIPSANLGGSIASRETLTNSLSEFLSNQLSSYLTDLLDDAFRGLGFVSDFNLRFNYRENAASATDPTNTRTYEIAPELVLFDGQARLISSNYLVDESVQGTYLANDLAIEINLRDDGRLVFRGFQTSDFELGSRKIEIGVGLRYRRSFDQFFPKKDKKENENQ